MYNIPSEEYILIEFLYYSQFSLHTLVIINIAKRNVFMQIPAKNIFVFQAIS